MITKACRDLPLLALFIVMACGGVHLAAAQSSTDDAASNSQTPQNSADDAHAPSGTNHTASQWTAGPGSFGTANSSSWGARQKSFGTNPGAMWNPGSSGFGVGPQPGGVWSVQSGASGPSGRGPSENALQGVEGENLSQGAGQEPSADQSLGGGPSAGTLQQGASHSAPPAYASGNLAGSPPNAAASPGFAPRLSAPVMRGAGLGSRTHSGLSGSGTHGDSLRRSFASTAGGGGYFSSSSRTAHRTSHPRNGSRKAGSSSASLFNSHGAASSPNHFRGLGARSSAGLLGKSRGGQQLPTRATGLQPSWKSASGDNRFSPGNNAEPRFDSNNHHEP
jgi:hypothetical protein